MVEGRDGRERKRERERKKTDIQIERIRVREREKEREKWHKIRRIKIKQRALVCVVLLEYLKKNRKSRSKQYGYTKNLGVWIDFNIIIIIILAKFLSI